MAASEETGRPGGGSPEAAGQPLLHTNWLAVGAIVAGGVVAAFQVGKVVIAVPALRADLGLDLTAAGWIMAIFSLLGVISGIPVGAAVGRFGAKNLLLVGLCAIAAGSAAGGSAGNFALLLCMRVVEGFGFVLTTIAGPALLRHVIASKDRDLAFGMWSAYMPTGMGLILAAGGLLHGWRGVWLATALLAAMAAALVFVAVPGRKTAGIKTSWRELAADAARTVRNPGSSLIAASFASYTLQYFALFSFLPVLLIERLGVTVTVAGAYTAVAAASNALGTLAAGVLLGRGLIPRWALIAIASGVMGICGAAIFIPGLPHAAVLVLCIVFSGVGGTLPSTLLGSAPLLAPAPRLAPVALGLAMQGSNVGQVLGPLAIGLVVDAFGWSAAAAIVLVSAALGITAAWFLRPIFQRSAR